MPFWPVAEREARAAARAPRTYGWRATVTAIGIAVIPISLWISRAGASQGKTVFDFVAVTAFIYALFGGVLRTADAIAEEKRENTLGLLFLTDLKVGDVLFGKLLASTATLFFGLLALLPLLSIAALLGGVSSRDLIRVALCLINSLFFAISLGFLVSTFFRQGWVTISVSLAAMLGIVFFIPIFASYLPLFLRSTLLDFSPATALGFIISKGPRDNFWQTLAATHLAAWLNILLTAHFLPKFWQERPRSRRAEVRFEKLRRLRFGSAKTRKKFRTRLLNRNPLFWLSGREQVSSFGLMVFMIFLSGLSLVGQWQQVIFALIAIHGTLLVRMASAASHALSEDRKSGALELLLATSLSVREVLKGRWMALGRQFFGPILIATMWHLFTILWMGVMSPFPKLALILGAAFFTFAFAWIATGWYGLWMGLRARHPVAAIWGTLAAVLLVPLVLIGGVFSVLAIFQIIPEYGFPGEHNFEVIGCVAWATYLLVLSMWTAFRVKRAFREAATDRYSDTQPIDWRPVWRITCKVAAASVLVIASLWGYRAWLNFNGERELKNVLAAHPTFGLSKPLARYIPDEENLAQWDYLKPLNGGIGYNVRTADSPTPFRESILVPWHPATKQLTRWRSGNRFSFDEHASHYWMTNYDHELTRLHTAARERPFLRFAVSPDAIGIGGMWQGNDLYYATIANIPRLLAVRAEKRLANGEHPLDDIQLALRFAKSATNDQSAYSNRKELVFAIIQPVYDGILDERWTDSDLGEIQNAFAGLDVMQHFQSVRRSLVREVANAFAAPVIGAGRPGAGQIAIGNMSYWVGVAPVRPRLPGKIKAGEARIIRAGLGETESPPTKMEIWPRQNVDYEDLELALTDIQAATLTRSLSDFAPMQVAVDHVIIACAIERFRLADGNLPQSLDQLAPKYLQKIPHDFVNGQPMKYKLTPEGYVLYSIGLNQIDDGGRPDTTRTIQGRTQAVPRDWVWIYKK
jgi:ABC-type transport system involved in multi-copper enzyme maturation permease subunit